LHAKIQGRRAASAALAAFRFRLKTVANSRAGVKLALALPRVPGAGGADAGNTQDPVHGTLAGQLLGAA
jgi:hypothetical protein